MLNISAILAELPLILEYFIPGFLAIEFYDFLISKKSNDHLIFESVAVSYIIKMLYHLLHSFLFQDLQVNLGFRMLILSTTSLISSVILVKFRESNCAEKMLSKINHKTIHTNIWDDILNLNNDTMICATFNNVEISGKIYSFEERGDDSWFVLKDYVIIESYTDKNGNKKKTTYNTPTTHNTDYKLCIKLGKADKVEIISPAIK